MRGFEAVSRFKDVEIQLPKRSTKHSAGYDFYAPEDIEIPSHVREWSSRFFSTNKIVKPFCIKTGIKAYMGEDEVLQLYMRSSNAGKLGLVCANSVGIIDSDYYNNPDNEGEIGFLVYNLSSDAIKIEKGQKLGQGVFTKFLLTDNDDSDGERTGGYGSTGK